MEFFRFITSNHIINVGVVAFFSAQILKIILTYVTTRKIQLERLMGAGGMPSSHSALTTSVAVAMLQTRGFTSPEFALSVAFAVVVMYDATGVRRAAGEQAKVLNRIVFEFPWTKHSADSEEETQPEPFLNKALKEYLGHTPFEVLGGFILGIIIALAMGTTLS